MVFSWNQYMKKNQAKVPMYFYNTRTECYFQKFTLTLFWLKFRESNSLLMVVDMTKKFSVRIFSSFHFSKNFVKVTVLLNRLPNSWFDEIFLLWEKNSVISTVAQCGDYGNYFSRIFCKNSVKVTVLLNKLLKSWFDEIFLRWERIYRFSTLWRANFLIFHTVYH